MSTGPEDNDSLSDILDERGRLLRMAYRILGSAAEAENVVRETYARWLRFSELEKAQITEPKDGQLASRERFVWRRRTAGLEPERHCRGSCPTPCRSPTRRHECLWTA